MCREKWNFQLQHRITHLHLCSRVDLVCVCVCVPADVMEGKNALLLGMSQWNSNDLVEQIETLGHMEGQSHGIHTDTYTHTHVLIIKLTQIYTHEGAFSCSHIQRGGSSCLE